MAIQSGAQLQPDGEGLSMTGFVNFGEHNAGTSTVGNPDRAGQIDTTVMQFIFLSLNGFRSPLSYILCKGIFAG